MRAVEALHKVSPSTAEGVPDTAWATRMSKQVAAETDRLEVELKGYKNNLIKESIRVRSFIYIAGKFSLHER